MRGLRERSLVGSSGWEEAGTVNNSGGPASPRVCCCVKGPSLLFVMMEPVENLPP